LWAAAGDFDVKSVKANFQPQARKHARRGDNADLLALAGAVRDARARAGLTQAQLALVSGVGRDTVIALENGRPGVSLGQAIKIMKGLGLTITHAAVKR
jgi:DNA-binding XRE family transcriptional regulator